MKALGPDSVPQPDSFDNVGIEYSICTNVWPSGNLRARGKCQFVGYDKTVGIFRTVRLKPSSSIAQSTAPLKVGFVVGPVSPTPMETGSGWMTPIPTIYDAHTLSIRPDFIVPRSTTGPNV